MPSREDVDVSARGPQGVPGWGLAGGFLVAVGATFGVFVTDDAELLRLAVVAVAWAFVIAAFAAGRRRADQAAAAGREAALRRTHEQELERETSAHREYELQLENELRRETEEAMRQELSALRRDLSGLSTLGAEVARLSALRKDVAALSGLREDVAALSGLQKDVAALSALRDDVAAVAALRADLGQLGELRADLGRMRVELTEQLSGQMLVERISMRTQAVRMPAEQGTFDASPTRAVDAARSWADDLPPRELTGGWPAIRLDEPRETQQFQQVSVERPAPAPDPTRAASWDAAPAAPSWEAAPPTTRAWPAEPLVPAGAAPSGPVTWSPSPAPSAPAREPAPPPPSARPPVPPAPTPPAPPEPAGQRRLEDILAENGAPPAGGRRRRRYRDDDDSDDVLARVLGRG